MLVITRNKGERIHIGENIDIVVVDVRHGRVKIGIEAPENTKVHRQEVHEAIKAGKRRNGDGDPLRGSPWAERIAEMRRAWIEQIRITRRLQKGKRK